MDAAGGSNRKVHEAFAEEDVFHDALEVHEPPAPTDVLERGFSPAQEEDGPVPVDAQHESPSSVQARLSDEEEEDEEEDQMDAEASTSQHDADAEQVSSGGGGNSRAATSRSDGEREAGKHGCEHYRRRCKIVAPCCSEAFWCRHCHNAEKNDNEQDPKLRHEIDRKKVVEVICALCQTRQPATRACTHCRVAFGLYTCLVCKFYEDDLAKEQFHCDECGICRVGGRANYFHCRTCNCCYAELLRDSHVCIENSMKHNCPVCFEYLFDSIKAINVMPCGHTIHNECLHRLADHSTYMCPVCSKSYMPPDRMHSIWQDMDIAVASTPMPTEYAEMRTDILCNDCGARSRTPFHVLGHKCSGCGGYNTRRV